MSVRDLFTREIWAPAAANVPAARPELAVGLVATQVLGLVMARYVIRAEPLASLPAEDVVGSIAPTLQHLLGGEDCARRRRGPTLRTGAVAKQLRAGNRTEGRARRRYRQR